MPLTKEQFQKARNSGYSVEQIAGFEKRRESEPQAKKPFSFRAEIAAPVAHGLSALAFDIPRTAMELQVNRGTPGAKQAYDYLYPEQTTKIGKALRFGSEAAGTVGGGAGKIASSIFRGAGKKLGIEATKQAVKEGAKLSFKQGAKQLGKKVIQGAASGVAFTGATAQPTREEYIEGLKSGAVYGAALPIAGEVAGKTGKAIRSLVKSKEDKIFNVYNKAFGVKEKTIRNLKKVKQSRVNAVKAIQEHLPDTPLQNNLTGETFGPVPTNRYEMIVSLESAKKNIWKKATELSQGATEKGAKIDLKSSVRDAYKKTLKDWGDVAVKTTKKGDIAKIKELADTIAVEGKISPFKSQDFMKSLFNDVKALSERGTPLDYSKKDFLYNLQANLNTSTDEVIELYLGKAGYKNLRSQYASLKGIEKEILAGANKYVKTQGGQSGGIRPIVNLWSLEEVASGMLTGNIQRVEQGIILKIASKVLDYFRSPDRNIKKMFKFASELPTAKPRFKPEILTDIQTSGQKLLRGRQPQARLPFETRRLPSPRNVPFNPPGIAPRPRPFAPPNVQGQGVIAGQAPYTGTTLPVPVRTPRQKLSFTKRSKQAKARSRGRILRSAGEAKVFPREIREIRGEGNLQSKIVQDAKNNNMQAFVNKHSEQADEIKQFSNKFNKTLSEKRFEDMSKIEKFARNEQLAHDAEIFLSENPTHGMSDKQVESWANRVLKNSASEANETIKEFNKKGFLEFMGFKLSKDDSMSAVSRAKAELDNLIVDKNKFIDSHKKLKALFFRDGKWTDFKVRQKLFKTNEAAMDFWNKIQGKQ